MKKGNGNVKNEKGNKKIKINKKLRRKKQK
jgi:hypothetical protein